MSSKQISLSPSSTPPLIKLVLIGDMGTGKSSIMHRYLENDFVPSFTSTIGADYRQKVVQVKGKDIKLQIFDTAGQERFFSITKAYFRGAHGVLLVYDITSKESLEHIKRWSTQLDAPASSANKILVGNKCDLESKRAVPTAKAQEVADQFGFKLMETSAKSGDNVDRVFMILLDEVLKRITPMQNEASNVIVLSGPPPKETDKCSC